MERVISDNSRRFTVFKDYLNRKAEDGRDFGNESWFRIVELENFTDRIINTPDDALMSDLEGIRDQILNNPNDFLDEEKLTKLLEPIEEKNKSNFHPKTEEDIA